MKGKRTLILVLLILAITFLCLGCGNGCKSCDKGKEDNSTSVTLELSTASKTMRIYDTFRIVASTNCSEQIKWQSSNPEVVSVEENGDGTITALSAGEAIIVASVWDASIDKTIKDEATGENIKGDWLQKKCYITVLAENRKPVIVVENAESEDKLTLGKNEIYQLKANIYFDGKIVEGTIKYHSNDESVATINEKGEIRTQNKTGYTDILLTGTFRDFSEDVLTLTLRLEILENAAITVTLDSDETIYGLDSYGGNSYKNSVGYSVKLTTERGEIFSGFNVESKTPSLAKVVGNQIIAMGAGRAEIEFSVNDNGKDYVKSVFINVAYIEVDNTASYSNLFERKKLVSMDAFKQFTTGTDITSVWDISSEVKSEVKIINGEFVNLPLGDKIIHIYSTVLSVKQAVHVVDHYITTAEQFKEIMPNATNDYIELGADILNVGDYKFSKDVIFTGVLDGKGYTVYGIKFSGNSALVCNLSGTIKNISFKNVSLKNTAGTLFNQTNGGVVDNVLIEIISAESEASKPVGGIGTQIDGVVTISNTVVIMNGIAGTNAGAVAGVWWGNGAVIINSYFITDGNPYGIGLGTSGNNALGAEENAKNSWEYIYRSELDFITEKNKQDSKIDLSGFKTEYWDMANGFPKFFFEDLNDDNPISVTNVNGDAYVLARNASFESQDLDYASAGYLENDYAKFKLPSSLTDVSKVFIDGLSVEFTKENNVISVDYRQISRLDVGEHKIHFKQGEEYYVYADYVYDYAIVTASDFGKIMANPSGLSIALANNIDGATVNAADVENAYTIFDGRSYVVNNLTVNGKGLFGKILDYSEIKNVAFTNVINNGTKSLWAEVVRRNTVFRNIFVSGSTTLNNQMISETNSTVKFYDCIFSYSNVNGLSTTISRSGTPTTDRVLYNDGSFFTTYSEGLPSGFSQDFGFDSTGSLTFNGNIVLANSVALTGSLYKNELYYFGKNATADHTIVLPQDVGTVTKIQIGGTEISGYGYAAGTKTLTIPKTAIGNIACGDTNLLVYGNAIYSAKVTVADYVINDTTTLSAAFSNLNGKYIVLSANVSASDITINIAGTSNGVVFDGKGFVISNLKATGRGLFGMVFSTSTVKNVAFVNLASGSSQGFFAQDSGNTTYENVFLSGTNSHQNKPSILKSTNSTTKFKNCIFSVQTIYNEDTAYVSSLAPSGSGQPSSENVILDDGANLAGYLTSGLPNGFGGDFSVSEGKLYFNGTPIK